MSNNDVLSDVCLVVRTSNDENDAKESMQHGDSSAQVCVVDLQSCVF